MAELNLYRNANYMHKCMIMKLKKNIALVLQIITILMNNWNCFTGWPSKIGLTKVHNATNVVLWDSMYLYIEPMEECTAEVLKVHIDFQDEINYTIAILWWTNKIH